jgi:UDP-N-acetylglucosamine diphosphorylase/glucosamine-1-phosphate N-acetyltransferase
MNRPLAAIVMAAGQGKRMADPSKPKVLYEIGGEPMLGHVLRLCTKCKAEPLVCIIGYGRDAVKSFISERFPAILTAVQDQQLGTAHAVHQAKSQLEGFQGDVLILSGDVPLLTEITAKSLISEHQSRNAIATVLSVNLTNPTGYGRIIRDDSGNLSRIVEEKDATPFERKVTEINSGIYVFDAQTLFSIIDKIDRKNAQGEYYLTDTFALLIAQGKPVAVAITNDRIEVSGVNTKDQLAELETEYNKRN